MIIRCDGRMTDPSVLPGHDLADFGDTWTFRPITEPNHGEQEQSHA